MKKVYIDEKLLIKEYIGNIGNVTLLHLSDKYGCDKRYIKKILMENCVYREPFIKTKDIDIQSILKEYGNKIPIYEISKKYLISHRRVVSILKNYEIINRGNKIYDFDRNIFNVINNEKRHTGWGFFMLMVVFINLMIINVIMYQLNYLKKI